MRRLIGDLFTAAVGFVGRRLCDVYIARASDQLVRMHSEQMLADVEALVRGDSQ